MSVENERTHQKRKKKRKKFNANKQRNLRWNPSNLYHLLMLTCRVKSRWFRIQFEELNPKFKGQERCIKEDNLKKAMKNANKSIYLVTAYIHGCLSNRSTTQEFEQVESLVEAACTAPDLSEVDHRAQRQFSVMLYCCKKVAIRHQILRKIYISANFYQKCWFLAVRFYWMCSNTSNSFVPIATYCVPDLSNIKGFSGHLQHSISNFANAASPAWFSKHINMLGLVCGLVWCFLSRKLLKYWKQVGEDRKRMSCHENIIF